MTFGQLVVLAAIASLGPTLAGVASFWQSKANTKKLAEIHIDINGRITELLRVTKESSLAEGALQQREVDRIK